MLAEKSPLTNSQVEITRDIVVVHHHDQVILRSDLKSVILAALAQARHIQTGVVTDPEHIVRVVTDYLEDCGVEIV